jgi:hypothetical protein
MRHVSEGDAVPWNEPIDEGTMADAIKFGRYAIEHARAAHNEMRLDKDVAGAVKMLDWIAARQQERFTPRDVLRGLNAYKTNAELVGPLTVLRDHGFIRPVQEEAGRREIYEVNPAVFDTTALPALPAPVPPAPAVYAVSCAGSPSRSTDKGVPLGHKASVPKEEDEEWGGSLPGDNCEEEMYVNWDM